MGRDMERDTHTQKDRELYGQRQMETQKCREKGRDTERKGKRQVRAGERVMQRQKRDAAGTRAKGSCLEVDRQGERWKETWSETETGMG